MKSKFALTLVSGCMAAIGADLPRDPTHIRTLSREVNGQVARFVNDQWSTVAPMCMLTAHGRLWLAGDIRVDGQQELVLVSAHGHAWQTCEDIAHAELTTALQKK